MRTVAQYKKDLEKMKTQIWMEGKKIEKFWENPKIQAGIESQSVTFKYAEDPQYEHMMTTISPLTGERVNRFTAMYQSADDLWQRDVALRTMIHDCGHCVGRCVGCDGLHAIGIVAYDVDQKYGTHYFDNFKNFLKEYQTKDLTSCGAVTDVKGDRSLRPHEQEDPDMYLHVVERRKDGIVVRGAKANITTASYSEEIIAVPTRAFVKGEEDWAICFAIPTDTPGIKHIAMTSAGDRNKPTEGPICNKFAFTDSLLIFDDVFVPNERIFMNGEWDEAARIGQLFGNFHRHSHCGCIASRIDNLVGACQLIAKVNGIDKKAHVKSKLFELIKTGEMVYACGLAASMLGNQTPSGIWQPNFIYSNLGKYYSGSTYGREMEICMDLAGGLSITMPKDEDYLNPETRPYMEKYLRGSRKFTADERIRAMRLITDLACSEYSAVWMVGGVIGAGAPEAQKFSIMANYDLDEQENYARKLCGIKPLRKE
jgi:4-hydroxyphenylacetate 3-monooxygenase/4-hydroxybutyryl-CoA dehydratase/vinylacetyl-CoA-Delta-isomerase